MPLKLHRRGKYWHVRGTVAGQYTQETTGTADRKRAEQYRAKREAELWDRRHLGARAVVTFEEAALSYIEARGSIGPSDRRLIRRLVLHFGATRLAKIDQSAVDRASRALHPDSAPATITRAVIGPLSAILTHAARRGWCDRPSFERPKQPPGRTRWLTPVEYMALEDAAADHLKPLLRFLVGTGARLSEGLYLDWRDVDLIGTQATFWKTKNGRVRHASLPPSAVTALANLGHREGMVFRRPDGEPYADRTGKEGGGQIKTAFRAACRRAGIEGATPHTLRHTWSSWFYAAHKDILALRSAGGWQSVAMVERYAKLVPADQVDGILNVWGCSPMAAMRAAKA